MSHFVSLGARAFLTDFSKVEKGFGNEDDHVSDDNKRDTDVDGESDLDA